MPKVNHHTVLESPGHEILASVQSVPIAALWTGSQSGFSYSVWETEALSLN